MVHIDKLMEIATPRSKEAIKRAEKRHMENDPKGQQFTNKEQSEWLLNAVGVPSNTADCYIDVNGKIIICHDPTMRPVNCTPCWSCGKLIYIYILSDKKLKMEDVCFCFSKNRSILRQILEDFEIGHMKNSFDFSKLED